MVLAGSNASNEASRKNLIYFGVEPPQILSNFAFEIKNSKFLIFIGKVIYFAGFMQQQVSEKYSASEVSSGTTYQTLKRNHHG